MRSSSFQSAAAEFDNASGYLAAATMGLPPRSVVAALRHDLDQWAAASCNPMGYDGTVARTRAHYARLVGVGDDRVAIGSQTSVLTALVAAAMPTGAEVLCVQGDFSSIVFPFLQRPDIVVRCVPLEELADQIRDETWLVAFSLVQSASGEVADAAAVLEASARHGAFTLCDTTQAVGVMPVDASAFDATVCHAYKWLCAPRGVAFLTLSQRFDALMTPLHAGWYAGGEVWKSCYGPSMTLATDVRRFDVSPAWQAWAGAEPAIALFAGLDIREVHDHAVQLANALCEGLGIAAQNRPIVTWADASGDDLARLTSAGLRASGRAGRLRAAFHLWNTMDDVERTVASLRG